MSQLKRLFEPIKVGTLELENRLVMAALGLGYCPDGWMTERMKAFYAERARGGVGLIICNISSTPVNGKHRGVAVFHDRYIPGLKELTDTVHAHGGKIAAQLIQRTMWAKREGEPPELIGPSDFTPPRGGRPGPKSRPLTIEEIGQIVEEKGEEARRMREAGFDAIQLHANVGTCLASYFISPLTNRRTDRYGGSMENRYRFLLDILASARKRVGNDFPIMCRISGADFLEGGYTVEDSRQAAPLLEKAGICALDVTTGWHEAPVPFFQMSVPQGAFVYLASEVKKAVRIPVIGGTKILDPALADRLIEEGKVDMVYMGRPLIADPELPEKARGSRFDEIRTCIACGYCFDSGQDLGSSACAINAQAGRETELTVTPAARKKRVLIVGGGPAGMEAARVASLRGHKVTLVEKRSRLGGTLNLAVVPPFKEDIGSLIKYLSRQMEVCGVEVKLNTEVTPEFIAGMEPDTVIIAVGASPLIPGIPGVDGENVTTALHVLAGKRGTGEKVVIIGGGLVGCETAEMLAAGGKKVTVLEMLGRIGNDISPSNRWVTALRLKQAGVKLETGVKAEEITPQGVKASREKGQDFFPADTVVIAAGMRPNDELYRHLQGKVAALYAIGDCTEPQRIADAMTGAFRVALEI